MSMGTLQVRTTNSGIAKNQSFLVEGFMGKHKATKVVDAPISEPEEARIHSGCDFEIKPQPSFYFDTNTNEFVHKTDKVDLVNSKTGECYGTASKDRYTIVQPTALDFMWDVKSLKNVAGGYKRGGTMYQLFKNEREIEPEQVSGAITKPLHYYTLAQMGFNLQKGIQFSQMESPYECANVVALGTGDNSVVFSHSQDIDYYMDVTNIFLKESDARVKERLMQVKLLAKKKLTTNEGIGLVAAIHGESKKWKEDKVIDNLSRPVKQIVELQMVGKGAPQVAGTAWDWLQAFTYRYNHEATVRNSLGKERITSALLGANGAMNAKAERTFMAFANAA